MYGKTRFEVRSCGGMPTVTMDRPMSGDFCSIVESLPIGVAVRDLDDVIISWNPAAKSVLFGDEIPTDVRDWRETIDPGNRRDFDILVDRAKRHGLSGVTTLRWDHPSRGSRWLRVNVAPWIKADASGDAGVNGTVVVIEDVTREVDARDAVDRLAQMLDSTQDYVAVFRPDGSPLYVNEMTRAALTQLREDGLGGALTDLVDPERLADLLPRLFVDGQGHWRGEFPIRVGGDREVPISAVGVTKRDHAGDLEWIAFLGRDMSSEKRSEDRLRRQAALDPLTALANRSRAIADLNEAVRRHERDGTGLGVLFCDLDGFKPVNDNHGHSFGDGVLVAVARRLVLAVRSTDAVARIGGDEFIIVVDEVNDVDGSDELEALAERVIESLTEPFVINSKTFEVGVSIGIAFLASTAPMTTADDVLDLADAAMYRAKNSGGNTYRLVAVGNNGVDR